MARTCVLKPAMVRASVAVVLAALALAAGAEARCRVPASATEVNRGSKAVAYVSKGHLYGCLRSSGHRVLVASDSEDVFDTFHLSKVRLAGRYVAFAGEEVTHYGEDVFTITSYDLGAARVKWETQVAENDPSGGETAEVLALALAPNGAFAYVARTRSVDHQAPPSVRVSARDRPGRSDRRLDSGDGIDPSSLWLFGGHVGWTNAGEQRSATLRR